MALTLGASLVCGQVGATPSAPPTGTAPQAPLPEAVAPVEGRNATVTVDDVLALAPAHASAIIYTAQPKALLMHPALELLPEHGEPLRRITTAVANVCDGPLLVTVGQVSLLPPSCQLTFATRTRLDRAQLLERIRSDWVPALSTLPGAGAASLTDDGELASLTLPGPVPLVLTLAVRDGMLLAGTIPSDVQAWHRGATLGARFVEGDAYRRTLQGYAGQPGVFAWIDVRGLIPLAAAPLGQTLPGLYDALQLAAVESVAFVAPPPRQPGTLRLAVGLSRPDAGWWHLFASNPAVDTLVRAYPPDTVLLLHGGMTSAATTLTDVLGFLRAIDPAITEEYEIERAEFQTETGLDFQGEFLANLGPEWTLGWRLRAPRASAPPLLAEPLLAVRLLDVDKFRAHLGTLQAAFGLPISSSERGDIPVYRAERSLGAFSYAVVNDVLLVSPDADAVAAGIAAWRDGKSLADQQRFSTVRRQLAPRTAKLVYADLGSFAQAVTEVYPDVPFMALAREFSHRDMSAALALNSYDRLLALDLAVTASDGKTSTADPWAALGATVRAALDDARAELRRAERVRTLHWIGHACHIYATNHQGTCATSLQVLVTAGLLTADSLCPAFVRAAGGDCASYYLYRPPVDLKSVKQPSSTVLIAEREVQGGGAAFSFLDGHTEWVVSPRAEELLAALQR